MKVRLFCWIHLIMWAVMPATAQTLKPVAVSDSVVQIGILGPTPQGIQFISMGSGFFAGDQNTIVTAAHVYWQAGKTATEARGITLFAQKASREGKKFLVPITLLSSNEKNDIAILRVDSGSIKKLWPEYEIKPLRIADREAELGEEVFYVGYFGSDLFPVVSRGIIAGTTNTQNIEEFLIDVPVNRGQSGGPVVSLHTSEVVGVVSSLVKIDVVPGGPQSHSGLSRVVKGQSVASTLKLTAAR